MSSFELESHESEDSRIVYVNVVGELDLTNAQALEERLEQVSRGDASILVLDLNRVVFIDSAALHVLFRTARRVGRDRFVVVCSPAVPIARTLRIVGLGAAAVIADSAESAREHLGT